MLSYPTMLARQRGFTMLEVLITLVILAFGILGLANLQAKVHAVEIESYQRAQAVLLLENMVSRINANRANAAAYVTGTATPLGEGEVASCAAPVTLAQIDQCQWSTSLKGVAETRGGTNVGAMTGARGCVEQLVAPVGAPTCTAGVYRVTVTWQGMNATAAPSLLCAQTIAGTSPYGGDALRRAIAARVTIGLPGCAI